MISTPWFMPLWAVTWLLFMWCGLKLIRRVHERKCNAAMDELDTKIHAYHREVQAEMRDSQGRYLVGIELNTVVMYSVATPLGDDVVLAARHHGDVGSLSTSISFEVYVTHGEKRLIIETLGTGFPRSQDAEKCIENFMRKFAVYSAVKAISIDEGE